MFISDIKKEFYEKLIGQRVLVLVSEDVDALCSCKILQALFQSDHIRYTLIPVNTTEDLVNAYSEYSEQVQHVVMINCGATYDILELLEPSSEKVVFYIADTHRPIDVINVYNETQVKLLMKHDSTDSIPLFEQLFRDDNSDSESENDSDDESVSNKRKKLDAEYLEKRREKRLWMDERQKIMFEYTQFSYSGLSSACMFFELAWKMSKDNNDLLWWSIVGLTDQYLSQKIERNLYILEIGNLQGHVSRHNNIRNDSESSNTVDSLKISFEKELRLNLYRHWSLYDSMKNTLYTACKFKLWSLKGNKRMYEFLADLGLPLNQCKQRFTSMDMVLRSHVQSWIEEKSLKYSLDDIVYGSFVAKYGFRHKFCAADVTLAVKALLESSDKEKSSADKFLMALDCLSRNQINILQKGIELAKKQLVAIFKQVQAFLDLNHIICAGPFLYAVIPEGIPDWKFFCHPSSLDTLAKFLLKSHICATKSKRVKNLPLVLTSSVNEAQSSDMCLVIGIPPLSEDSQKNLFGKAFEQAALKTNSKIKQDYFDSSVIEMRSEDRSKFFDALIALLS